jgi:hypothetical protein
MSIHSFRTKSVLQWKTKWVKGHQDDNVSYESLDRLSLLNVIADRLAKSMLPIAKLSNRPQQVEGSPWSVWHQGTKLFSPAEQIYELLHSKEALAYWQNRGKVEPLLLDFIDWEIVARAIKTLPKIRQHFISKHTVGMCGVGKWMVRWNEWPDPHRPRCGANEDATHVWLCQGNDSNALWVTALQSLQEWMVSVQTDPGISKAIITGLNNWRCGSTLAFPSGHYLHCAVYQQSDIGWGNLLEGWISIEWVGVQQQFYTSIHSRRSGRYWAVLLLHKLWSIARELWEHRNMVLHQQKNVISDMQDTLLHRKIQRLYSKLVQLSLATDDSYLCTFPLPILLKKTWSYKIEWVRSVEIVLGRVQGTMQRTLRNLRHMRATMRRWLQSH